jgi:hypothetical protein
MQTIAHSLILILPSVFDFLAASRTVLASQPIYSLLLGEALSSISLSSRRRKAPSLITPLDYLHDPSSIYPAAIPNYQSFIPQLIVLIKTL